MISDFLPKIDATKCIGCEICVKLCPNNVFSLINDTAVITNPEACDYVGACQEICPTEAISLTYELVFPTTNEEDVKGGSMRKNETHLNIEK